MLGPLSETTIEEWLHEGGANMKRSSGVGRHGVGVEGRPSEGLPHTAELFLCPVEVEGRPSKGPSMSTQTVTSCHNPTQKSVYLVLLQQLAVPAQEYWNKVVPDVVGLCYPGNLSTIPLLHSDSSQVA